MLRDKNVDPSVNSNFCVLIAADKNYYEIVSLLLEDPRVNPSTNDNQ